MTALEAYNYLNPEKWAQTSAVDRLALLEQVQHNMKTYAEELGGADANMKNALIGEELTSLEEGMGATIMAVKCQRH